MSQLSKIFLLATVSLFSICLVTGCNQGSTEKAGKKVDNAVEHVSDTLQDKGPAQKAGEKVDELAKK